MSYELLKVYIIETCVNFAFPINQWNITYSLFTINLSSNIIMIVIQYHHPNIHVMSFVAIIRECGAYLCSYRRHEFVIIVVIYDYIS